MRSVPLPSLGAVLAVLLLAGCGDGDSEARGSAPQIADLSCSRQTLPLMEDVHLYGSFTMRDADADVVGLTFRFKRPDGTVDTDQPVTIEGGAGISEDTVTWSVDVIAAEPGLHWLEMWLGDGAGNVSNHVACELVASAPH